LEWENLNDNPTFVQAAYSTHEENPFDDQVLVLTEDQIVQPLANQGALKTKHVQTLEKLKRIENALISYMATHWEDPEPGSLCSRKVRIPFADDPNHPDGEENKDRRNGTVPYQDLYLEESDVRDPWGQPIQYKIEIDGTASQTASQNVCYAGVYTFKLRSSGPDEELGNKDDDVPIVRLKPELVGILMAAGINPNSNSPAGTDPPTAKK
jgi:hypothetical protein